MNDTPVETGTFNGIAGRVLMGALTVEALITGLAVVGLLKAVQFGLTKIGQESLTAYVAVVVVAIVLARFALNGRAGETRGTLFSEEGGSSGQAVAVGIRFLALWALWLVPLEMLGLTPPRLTQTFMNLSMGQVPVGTITMTLAVVLVMAACPAIFLVLAVGSPSFLEILVPTRWSALFRGRFPDLFSIYVIHLGVIAVIAAIGVPLVVAGGMIHPMTGTILSWAVTILATGVAIDLMGRLCGFFVLTGDADGSGSTVVDAEPVESGDSSLAPVLAGDVAAPGTTGYRDEPALPELDNARERVRDIVEGLAGEPERLLIELEDLQEGHAPHPLILHSLCLLYERYGRRQDSMRIAPRALSVCIDRGADWLAGEVLSTRIDMVREFGLDRRTMMRLAETLHEHDLAERSETVYRALLEEDPGDRIAIKGLLKVGERCLRQNSDPARAREIYAFLLKIAEGSPLADFMRDGLAEAERRLAA